MKKIFKNACLLTLCAVTLVGCGNSKVEYATFKAKGEEALKTTPDYTSASVNGNVKAGSTTLTVSFKATVKDRTLSPDTAANSAYTDIINELTLQYFILADEGEEDVEYYAGSTFEMKYVPAASSSSSSEASLEAYYAWNEYGLLTSAKTAYNAISIDFTVSYSK